MEDVIRDFLEENWEHFLEKADNAGYSEEEVEQELDRILSISD